MDNIYHITDKLPIKKESLDDHIIQVGNIIDSNKDINMGLTILVDNHAGMWNIQQVVCNMSNAEVFILLDLVKQAFLDSIRGRL